MSNKPDTLRIGLIGLDTSHVVAFSKLLNDPSQPEHIPGAKVTCGFPGGSPDFELSRSRVEGYTKQISQDYGVEIMSSPAAVAEAVDLVFITAVDGRQHLDLFRQALPFRRPTFIDKPMATRANEAEEMFRLAAAAGIPLASASSLRFAESLTTALKRPGAILGCDVFGPMQLQPALPGLFWYGIHMIDILSVVMGTGCAEVKATVTPDYDHLTATWSDGRIAGVRGIRKGHHQFGITLHREDGFQAVDLQANARSWYATMLAELLRTLPNGTVPVPPADTCEVMHIVEAANQSRETGKAVAVARTNQCP